MEDRPKKKKYKYVSFTINENISAQLLVNRGITWQKSVFK